MLLPLVSGLIVTTLSDSHITSKGHRITDYNFVFECFRFMESCYFKSLNNVILLPKSNSMQIVMPYMSYHRIITNPFLFLLLMTSVLPCTVRATLNCSPCFRYEALFFYCISPCKYYIVYGGLSISAEGTFSVRSFIIYAVE